MRVSMSEIFPAERVRALAFASALSVLSAWAPQASAQPRSFPSPEAAMSAFGDAVATSDDDALRRMLGSGYDALVPPLGAPARYDFLAAWSRGHAVRRMDDGRAFVEVGGDGWTMPIPIVQGPQGWRFDSRGAAEEIRIRQVGRNERAVMQVMLAIVDAQKEYASRDRNGDGVREYASRFLSTAGRRDGLYWPTVAGEPPSPLGPAVDAERGARRSADTAYYGYRYRLLDAQGTNAAGGAYDYAVGGRKIGGFAAIAWPARYGSTGVATFIVNHDGVVFEQDLGRGTASRAEAIRRFDPGPGWRKSDLQ
jgi:hypothetical protein